MNTSSKPVLGNDLAENLNKDFKFGLDQFPEPIHIVTYLRTSSGMKEETACISQGDSQGDTEDGETTTSPD